MISPAAGLRIVHIQMILSYIFKLLFVHCLVWSTTGCLLVQGRCNEGGGGPGTYFAPHGLAHYNFLVGGIWDCYRKKYVKKSFVRNCFDDVEHGDKVFEMVCFHDESPVVSLPNQSRMTSLKNQSNTVKLCYQSPSSPLFHESWWNWGWNGKQGCLQNHVQEN